MQALKGPIYTISELADELGITTRTIRYYEEVGLIEPQRHADISQRLYSSREKARLKLILRGKRLGFSLAEIKEMIDLYDVDPSEKEQLIRTIEYGERRLREIEERFKDLQIIKEELIEYHQKLTQRLKELNEEVNNPDNPD